MGMGNTDFVLPVGGFGGGFFGGDEGADLPASGGGALGSLLFNGGLGYGFGGGGCGYNDVDKMKAALKRFNFE